MKLLRNILKGASLTGALFVFQACYGTPEAPLMREHGTARMSFSVVSRSTGEPLEGIDIQAKHSSGPYSIYSKVGATGADGRCTVDLPYSRNIEGPFIRFADPQNRCAIFDTTLTDLREREIVIKLYPKP